MSTDEAAQPTVKHDVESAADAPKEAEVLSESRSKESSVEESRHIISPGKRPRVRLTTPQENLAIEFQKMAAKFTQEGPYIGSHMKNVKTTAIDIRRRREIVRVPQYKPPWRGFETSFRRIPPWLKLPNEWELRGLYPLSTKLHIEYDEAPCADLNGEDCMMDPLPIKYCKLLPPDYDPGKEYPYMVALPDWRGLETDFEDMCAHLFERPAFYRGLLEQKWVVFAPLVNMRHSSVNPIEGVIARFCDWVTENFNVEGGKVHLFGKGLGGNAAMRTCLYHKGVATSCTAILGRLSTPLRPMDRPMDKMKNLEGTHMLMIVPGGMRKVEYPYKFKAMADYAHVEPPVRCIHFADVRDHQVYYAINPYEFWNYLSYFRSSQNLPERVDMETMEAEANEQAAPHPN